MDPLRDRFAALPGGRLKLLLAAAAVAVVLGGAVVIAAAQASGSTAALPAVRPVATVVASPTPVLVHVSGAVRHPGLVALPAGSRIVDAVTAAGGPTAKADDAAINLAARIVDGQQIVVPERGAPAAPAAAGAPAAISLATATAEQLETLPRIGPSLAARIIAYREAHGGFSSVDELGKVGGIGPKTLAGLRDLVTP